MPILTQALRRHIHDLREAVGVRAAGEFMAQGTKAVADTFGHFELRWLLATPAWIEAHDEIGRVATNADLLVTVTNRDLDRMSTLKTAPPVIAVYALPEAALDVAVLRNELVVALDDVQDPGNLGTIIRVADWMGVRHILCSPHTAYAFAPKVIQATMGAISRVSMHYCDLREVLPRLSPVYGTYLEGENIYTATLTSAGVILMGSEGHGISAELAAQVTRRLFIPPYPAGAITSESLNVAVATSIILAEFRRRDNG